MKKGDYKTLAQAQKYYQERFTNGLEIVNYDEMNILNKWLKNFPAEGKIVLDLGSGTGRVLENLLNYKTKKIYALDKSDAMLNFLGRIYTKETKDSKVEAINSTSDKIPLNNNSIDLVTAFHLFKHLSVIKPTLSQVNKVLKPGGYFIFDILNANSLIKFNPGDCYILSEDQIKSLLEKQGFNVKDMINIHPLGETVYSFFGKSLSIFLKIFETILKILGFKFGTKIFILAQKI